MDPFDNGSSCANGHYFASPKQAEDGTYFCPKCNVKNVAPGVDGVTDGGRCRKGHYFEAPTHLGHGAFACPACESTDIEPYLRVPNPDHRILLPVNSHRQTPSNPCSTK